MSRSVRTEYVLDLMETLLHAQLDSIQIRRIRAAEGDAEYFGKRPVRKRRSHVDMAGEVLAFAEGPLHIGELTRRVRETYAVFLTRESLAAAVLREAKTHGRI